MACQEIGGKRFVDPLPKIQVTMKNEKCRDKTAIEFGEALTVYLGKRADRSVDQVGPGESLQQGSSGVTLQQGGSGAPFSMEQTAWLCEFLAKEKAGSSLSFAAPETSRNGEFLQRGRTGIL